MRRDVPASLLREVALSRGVTAAEVQVANIALAGSAAFIAYSVKPLGQTIRVCEGWVQNDGEWSATTSSPPELWPDAPMPGSNETLLYLVEADRRHAACGFVDPTLTRVISLTAAGDSFDTTSSTASSIVVLLPEEGQVLGFRGGTLLFANPVTLRPFPFDRRVQGDDAQAVADEFTRAMLGGNQQAAAPLVSGDRDQEVFVRQLAEVLGGLEASNDDLPAQETGFGYEYAFSSSQGPMKLELELDLEGESWRIWSYVLTLASSNQEA